LHYELKEAFENVLVSFKREGDQVDIYIVNDLLNDIDETLKIRLVDFQGNKLWNLSKPVKVTSNSSMLVDSFIMGSFEEIQWNQVVLEAQYGDASNTHFFVKPKELALDNADINFKIEKAEEGFSIDLTSPVLQKNLMLMTPTDGYFSDDFFDLIPKKTKTVLFKTDASSIEELTYNSLNKLQTK
jgi:beta-mannosidase